MKAAEPWPTEEAATKAVDAVARTVFNKQFPPGSGVPTFDDLPANEKLVVKNSILSIVWAALEALPDPRYEAWELGYLASGAPRPASAQVENPYPSGL